MSYALMQSIALDDVEILEVGDGPGRLPKSKRESLAFIEDGSIEIPGRKGLNKSIHALKDHFDGCISLEHDIDIGSTSRVSDSWPISKPILLRFVCSARSKTYQTRLVRRSDIVFDMAAQHGSVLVITRLPVVGVGTLPVTTRLQQYSAVYCVVTL